MEQPTVVPTSLTTLTLTTSGQSVVQQPANVVTLSTVMGYVYIVIGSIGIVTNIGVICVISTSKHMRHHVHNLFLINQSVADLWSSVFVVAVVYKNIKLRLEGWEGELICRLWLSNLPLWIGFISSLYNLVALSIERYFEIVHPIQHKLFFNRRKAALSIAAVWVFSLIMNLLTFAISGGVKDGVCFSFYFWYFPGAKPIFGIFNISVKMFIPIGVFVFSYISMARSLNTNKIGAGIPGPQTSTTKATVQPSTALTRASRNVIKTLAYAVIIHVVSWSVNQFLFFSYTFGYALDFTSVLYSSALAVVYLSTCTNPIIYVLKYERFRKALRDIWQRKRSRTSPVTSHN